jgi:Spy/CpxP family protein refolding chaperone
MRFTHMAGKVAVIAALAAQTWGQDAAPRVEPRREGDFARGHGERRTGENAGIPPIMRLLESSRFAKELALTEAQIKTFRDAEFDLQKRHAELRAEIEKASLDQAKLLTESAVDEKAVMAAVEKTGALRTEIAKLQMKQLLLIRSTLTPEQRAKVQEIIRQFAERRRHAEGTPAPRPQARAPGPNAGNGPGQPPSPPPPAAPAEESRGLRLGPHDIRAQAGQFALNAFVAAINYLRIVDHALPAGA